MNVCGVKLLLTIDKDEDNSEDGADSCSFAISPDSSCNTATTLPESQTIRGICDEVHQAGLHTRCQRFLNSFLLRLDHMTGKLHLQPVFCAERMYH